VQLPEDGRLFVDGVAQAPARARRTFETPKLEPGKTYYYVFRADVVRDGKTESDNRRVIVQAGKDVTVDFRDMATVTTASR
jgi:uncharacterized protein (TIGR03000 family)